MVAFWNLYLVCWSLTAFYHLLDASHVFKYKILYSDRKHVPLGLLYK